MRLGDANNFVYNSVGDGVTISNAALWYNVMTKKTEPQNEHGYFYLQHATGYFHEYYNFSVS